MSEQRWDVVAVCDGCGREHAVYFGEHGLPRKKALKCQRRYSGRTGLRCEVRPHDPRMQYCGCALYA